MASKYVPPHLRNPPAAPPSVPYRSGRRNPQRYRAPEPEPVEAPPALPDVNSDHAFPQLVNTAAAENKWTGKKSFAIMATEWKDAEEIEKIAQQTESFTEFRLPRFTNQRRYVEPDEEYEEEEAPVERTSTDEGWTEVKPKIRKIRREKTIEERIAEEEAAEQEKQAETCWNEDDDRERGDKSMSVWN